jgi:hypothetical protein
MNDTERDILIHALAGYEQELQKVTVKISEIQGMLLARPRQSKLRVVQPSVLEEAQPKRKHHRMSAAGRKAIAAAQRARWAKIKAAKKKVAAA